MTNGESRTVFPLRLPRTTRAQATAIARDRGISINDFVTEAIAEKIERLKQFRAPVNKPKPAHAERRDPNKKRPGATRASGQS